MFYSHSAIDAALIQVLWRNPFQVLETCSAPFRWWIHCIRVILSNTLGGTGGDSDLIECFELTILLWRSDRNIYEIPYFVTKFVWNSVIYNWTQLVGIFKFEIVLAAKMTFSYNQFAAIYSDDIDRGKISLFMRTQHLTMSKMTSLMLKTKLRTPFFSNKYLEILIWSHRVQNTYCQI